MRSTASAGQAYAELLHEVFGEEGIHVSHSAGRRGGGPELIIGGAIVEGDKDKDSAVLADKLWDLHTNRVQVASD